MNARRSSRRQSGAVLIVALMFLVVLTMLGVTAMTGTTFEERMAGNARDSSVARHAAEAALRRARNMVLGLAQPTSSTVMVVDGKPRLPLFSQAPDANGLCIQGLCSPRKYTPGTYGLVPPDIPAGVDWSEGGNTAGATTEIYAATGTTDALKGVSKSSRFIIEMFCIPLAVGGLGGVADDCRLWRFTAVGWGKNPNTQVTVQEFYISEADKK